MTDKSKVKLFLTICLVCDLAPVTADITFPTNVWIRSSPEAEGLNRVAIERFDAEIREGVFGNIDSMLIIRDGRIVFEAIYQQDYLEKHAGLSYPSPPPWDYFNTEFYPWRLGTELHTMQSVTKSVMSALIGIAIDRGEIPGIDATLGDLLSHRAIKNSKMRGIKLKNILTMTAGIKWNEDASYFDLNNDATFSERTDDWVAYLLKNPYQTCKARILCITVR